MQPLLNNITSHYSLAHAPAAAQCLGLVEGPRLGLLHTQEPHVMGPRQRESCRRGGPRFRRRCLRNLPAQVEEAHLLEVAFGKPAPESRGQIVREALQKGLAVGGPPLPDCSLSTIRLPISQ